MSAGKQALPAWLIADDGGDRDFVLHLHWPRFILEFRDGEGEIVLWIDPEEEVIRLEQEAGREPATLIARLMRQAGDFFFGVGWGGADD